MGSKAIVIYLFILCFSKCYSQCDDDQCFRQYQQLVQHEKGSIQKMFDGILEKYGDVDGDLRNVLDTLNNTILKTDLELDKFEKNNSDLKKINNQSNSTLLNLLEEAKSIENGIENIGQNLRNWLEEAADANKSANLIITTLATLNDIETNEKELEKWKKMLENFDVNNYAKDIMNIPHSVSDDLNLLEILLDEKQDTTCFNKFHEDLKNLFAQLSGLLNFDGAQEEIRNIKKKADTNKKDADEILTKTNNFLEEEKHFKDIHNLLNETLVLAEEVEKLKSNINDLLKNKENIFNDKLQELQKSHDADLKELYKKYNINEFEILLDELEDVNKQIREKSNGENNNIDMVEGDIEKYIDDINYYSCVLEDCRYRKPAEAVTTFNCKQKSD